MKKWLSKLCLKTAKKSQPTYSDTDPEEGKEIVAMTDSQSARLNTDNECSPEMEQHASTANNIIENHDFSNGLQFWNPNSCQAYVASNDSGYPHEIKPQYGKSYAVVTGRTQSWQGLEQDITAKVVLGTMYMVSSYVRVCGKLHENTEVQATVKAEYSNSDVNYIFVGRIPVTADSWTKLEGSFSLENSLKRAVFYLEGPPPGVILLVNSVIVSSSPTKHIKCSPEMEQHASTANNIIENHDFSNGLQFWNPNSCQAYVASNDSGYPHEIKPQYGKSYAVVTGRTQSWQGLEQDITAKVVLGTMYMVSSYVRVCGKLHENTEVQATVKAEYSNSDVNYIFVGRIPVTADSWTKLEGSFSLENSLKRAVFYLEGPPPGVILLVNSVIVSSSSTKRIKETLSTTEGNIVQNFCFEDGLNNWSGRGCKIILHNKILDGNVTPLHGHFFASATERSHNWNGIQQDISDKVHRKLAYEVTAVVRIRGNVSAVVRASLWVQAPNGHEQYISIASLQASNKEWTKLHGRFLLNSVTSKVVIYLEGPPMGTEILVDSLVVKHAKKKLLSSPPPDFEITRDEKVRALGIHNHNIIQNHDFSKGLVSWSLNSCDGYVVSGESSIMKGVTALTGLNYAIVTNRTETWQGLEQDITSKVSAGHKYNMSAYVRVWGGRLESGPVIATLKLEHEDSQPSYIFVARVLGFKERWEKLEGIFSLDIMPRRVVFFIEGPSPGQDLLVDSVKISCSSSMHSSSGLYGVNIIENSNLNKGLNGWAPLGSCTLKICTGSPYVLPKVAIASLMHHEPLALSGHYILAANRTEPWMGPSQTITDRLKLHVTYQIAAWVRVGCGASGPQHINIALGVDNQWVNGGQVEATDDKWHEVVGSFRIEKQPKKVLVYVQGPSKGVDLMVAGLHIFAVDRKGRFELLKEKTDKVRKRNVILKFQGMGCGNLSGAPIAVRQIKNSFPMGSCINRSNIDNEEFVDFFLQNFNWAVFGNELKWYATEPEQGKLNYKDADEMLNFCLKNNIICRGHCIFWEVEDAVQPWVKSLNQNDLMLAIKNRLTSLLLRYKGKFKHYDVNNEMLHGSFYQDKLGKYIRAYMFNEAHRLDPSAILFVNDYNVEDGCDSKSTPEMYIQQILDLQEQGSKVGGIGIQGHITHPVGSIICNALDKLEILGLPIWFTELDVMASNEHVRADDLEVMLREAYAHPSVEGIVLWGFWELFMCREDSHLVDAEGEINEAGKCFLALKQEWLTNEDGDVNDCGEFRFRGYQGTYNLEITTHQKKTYQTFVVDKGEGPLVITINL